jgi:hypothetical protein
LITSPVDNRPEQTTIEEILLRVLPRVGYRRRGAERLFEREQSFKHADRRVEGRADRAALRLAIPAAIPSCSLSNRSTSRSLRSPK